MNGMLSDLLSERADAAGSPDLDLEDLIARGERRVSRRRRVALGGTVAAVVLTVGASVALSRAGDRTAPPVTPPTTPPSTGDVRPDNATASRPLTYGVGATIHWGERIIEAPKDADGIYMFDDGLAILTEDDGRKPETHLYFTDGSDPVEIAHGIGMVVGGGEVGSLLVWSDGDDVVIYDTRERGVVARVPLNGLRLGDVIPIEDGVYWEEYREDAATTERRAYQVRYDVSTGTRTRVSRADYEAATTRTTPPVIAVGSADSGIPAESFTVVDSQLGLDTRSESPGPAFVAATGERLQGRVPDGYDGVTMHIFQWLDDDRFALVAEGGAKRAPIGDLLVCRISAGQCHTIADGEQYWLLPHIGGVGAED